MKSRILILLLLVSLGINIGFLLHWFWPKGSVGDIPASRTIPIGWYASHLRHNFGLSSKQMRLMENERRNVLAQAHPLQNSLHQKRRELFAILKNKTIQHADLDGILNEIARLQAGIEKMFIMHSLKMKRFFSPAQLQKYEEFFEQGLCPGMKTEKSCPSGKMFRHGHRVPGCENLGVSKK